MADNVIINYKLLEKVGLVPAIITHFFVYWSNYNETHHNNSVYVNGAYWVRQSYSKMSTVIKAPKLSPSNAAKAIKKLIDEGFLECITDKTNPNNKQCNLYRPTTKLKEFLGEEYDDVMKYSNTRQNVYKKDKSTKVTKQNQVKDVYPDDIADICENLKYT